MGPEHSRCGSRTNAGILPAQQNRKVVRERLLTLGAANFLTIRKGRYFASDGKARPFSRATGAVTDRVIGMSCEPLSTKRLLPSFGRVSAGEGTLPRRLLPGDHLMRAAEPRSVRKPHEPS